MNQKSKKSRVGRKVRKVHKPAKVTANNTVEVTEPSYPQSEEPLPIPIEKEDAKKANRVMELAFMDYLRELGKDAAKDNSESMAHLHNILSEFLGAYILIGYLPDDNPIEIMSAETPKDKEAVFERLRKTFMRYMNLYTPG